MKNGVIHLLALGSWLVACAPGTDSLPRPTSSATLAAGSGAAGGGLGPKPAAAGTGLPGVAGQPGLPTTTTGTPGIAGRPAPQTPPPAAGVGPIPMAGRPAVPPPPATAGGPAQPAAGGASSPPPATGDRATVDGVCGKWKADRANVSEGMWTGNVMSCDPGDMGADARANALRVLNLYRWLAGMPELTTDPQKDQQAQACALLMNANNMLSHMPPSSWTCYMDVGAMAAGRCNISSGPAVSSVDGYMVDPGNDTTIGHRRWILSNSIGPTGIGGTSKYSCLMTTGNMRVGKPWMAWPSPGIIPIQAMQQGFGNWVQKVDVTGWSIQSDTINLANAQVSVMSDGMAQPVTVTQLLTGYGSRYALRFNPMGWSSTAGKTYTVMVSGVTPAIQYDVTFADCK